MDRAKVVDFIGRVPVVGQTLRKLARRYPEGSVVPIRTGVAAGWKWRRHHRYVNGYWVGHYELGIQDALRRELKGGDTFFDVGANAGFFTLVAAKLVGPTGRCVAFDPDPLNCESIREQIDLNGLGSYCTAVTKAVGGAEGRATFSFAAGGSPMGHLGGADAGEKSVEVEVTTLDAAAALHGAPSFIKLDVEGAEGQALAGARAVLSGFNGAPRPGWLIELHGPQCAADVKRDLTSHGYLFFGIDGRPVPADAELPHHVIARPGR
jgi:FkbM family methyltransferase